ncbi:MAG: hypothetical protein NTW52_19520 [Planctomycetota bacterium]|nr:hypothetical protein [Planctomycetota bacterium]
MLPTAVASWFTHIVGSAYNFQNAAYLGLAIWVAIRCTIANKKTFFVPCVLMLIAGVSPAMEWIVASFSWTSVDFFPVFAFGGWSFCIRTIVHYAIMFSLVFRAVGICLAPIRETSTPKPLTISVLMGLTGVLACSFAVDMWIARQQSSSFSMQSAIMSLPSVMTSMILGYAATATLVLGAILLWIPNRACRLLGMLCMGIWILVTIATGFLYYLVVLPAFKQEIDKLGTSNGTVVFSHSPSILVLVGQNAVTFVSTCAAVGLFHFAGYRWDRKQPSCDGNSVPQEPISFTDID